MKIGCVWTLGVLSGLSLCGVVWASDNFDKASSDPIGMGERDVSWQSMMNDQIEGGLEEDRTAVVANAVSSPYPNTTGARRSLRLAGSVFSPRDSSANYQASSGGGCIQATSGKYSVFTAPVILPQGAAVEYVRMYGKDTNATVDTKAWFTVYDLYGHVATEYPMQSSGSAGEGYWTTDKIDPVRYIDYNTYSYVLNWRPYADDGSIALCGFRLFYYMPSVVR